MTDKYEDQMNNLDTLPFRWFLAVEPDRSVFSYKCLQGPPKPATRAPTREVITISNTEDPPIP